MQVMQSAGPGPQQKTFNLGVSAANTMYPGQNKSNKQINQTYLRTSQGGQQKSSSRQNTLGNMSNSIIKSFHQANTQNQRASSTGQNNYHSGAAAAKKPTEKARKTDRSKDAYSAIQEQMRAEQAKQPQNQFEHQESILKALNSNEVYQKLMKIKGERDALYEEIEAEERNRREASVGSGGYMVERPTGTAEPGGRGSSNRERVGVNPYNQGDLMQSFNAKKASQNIPLKNVDQQQHQAKFQQYVIAQGTSNNQVQNSRNAALKAG